MFGYNLRLPSIFVLAICLIIALFSASPVSAAQLTSRSVRISNSLPSASNEHRFSFNIATVGTLGSMEFEYCSNSPLVGSVCTAPAGLNLSGVSLSGQTGETGFSIDPSSTVNRILLTRAPGANAAIPVTYRFSNVVNHSTPNSPVFVRITTYPTIDGSGAWNDDGAVAFSTTTDFNVEGYVPPYLTFCVGVTVSGNCSSASGQQLNFGELSSTEPRFATSQFAGATNDPGGYSTTVTGLTMTSGTNTIPALNNPTPSQTGVSQFGMNLRANTIPGVGSNPSGIGTSSPAAVYNQPNLFTFKNQVVSNSNISTDFNVFTVSYIVNISTSQPAGIYNTTLTYIAVAAF